MLCGLKLISIHGFLRRCAVKTDRQQHYLNLCFLQFSLFLLPPPSSSCSYLFYSFLPLVKPLLLFSLSHSVYCNSVAHSECARSTSISTIHTQTHNFCSFINSFILIRRIWKKVYTQVFKIKKICEGLIYKSLKRLWNLRRWWRPFNSFISILLVLWF